MSEIERCERCRRPLEEHGTIRVRRPTGTTKHYVCPATKGYAVEETVMSV